MTIKVRRASADHIADAQLLLEEYYAAVGVMVRDTPGEIQGFIFAAGSGLWIAYQEEIPAGCVVFRSLAALESVGECKRLYVRPRSRGQGIAGLLLDALEAHARATGVAWVYLDSKDDLQEALRLYHRRGYEPCARYNDNPQATVFLRRRLARPGAA